MAHQEQTHNQGMHPGHMGQGQSGRNMQGSQSQGMQGGQQGFGQQGMQGGQGFGQNPAVHGFFFDPLFDEAGEFWNIPGPFTGVGPKNYQRSDQQIQDDVCHRLTQHGQLDASDIDVSVKNGVVTLKGTVDSRRDKRMAEDTVDSVRGVQDVQNDLKIQSSQQGQGRGQSQTQSQTGTKGQQTKALPAEEPTQGTHATH